MSRSKYRNLIIVGKTFQRLTKHLDSIIVNMLKK